MHKTEKEAQESIVNKLSNPDGRQEILRIASQFTISNWDIVSSQCCRSGIGKILMDDISIRNAWRRHFGPLFNKEFKPVDAVCGPPPLLERFKVKEVMHNRQNGKAAGSSGITVEMLKASDDTEVEMVTD